MASSTIIPSWKRCDICGASHCIYQCEHCGTVHCSKSCARKDEKHEKICPNAIDDISQPFISMFNQGLEMNPIWEGRYWHPLPGPITGKVPYALYGKNTEIFDAVSDGLRYGYPGPIYYFIPHEDVGRVFSFRLSPEQFAEFEKLLEV